MKKSVIFLAVVTLIGTSLQAETASWQEDNIITKVIDDNLFIVHRIGNSIEGRYNEKGLANLKVSTGKDTITVTELSGKIDYSQGQLNFDGTVSLTLPAKTTESLRLGETFDLKINNVTTPEQFEQKAKSWIDTEAGKYFFHPKPLADFTREQLKQALQLVVKKWKELIVIFKANIDEQLQSLQKKDQQPKVQAAIEKSKGKLENIKAKLMKFKA